MVRKGGTVNLFAGCVKGTEVKLDPVEASLFGDHDQVHVPPHAAIHARGAGRIARGEIRASDLITGEAPLAELPRVFEQMKHRNGTLKTAIIP